MGNGEKATLYRMVMDKHICPYGLKSKDLLVRRGYVVEDYQLRSREEVENFKIEHRVKTTPQTFINNERIGGYSELLEYFGMGKNQTGKVSYTPIIAVFSVTFLMALALSWLMFESVMRLQTLEFFISLSMCVLAILKLRDLEAFSLQFITYDILAQRKVGYSYFYPVAEAIAGIGMLGHILIPIVSPIAVFIGSVGTLSVVKAVYVDKRELKCACVGGNSNVPLGFISVTENVMMIIMGFWMLFR